MFESISEAMSKKFIVFTPAHLSLNQNFKWKYKINLNVKHFR